MAKPVYDLDNFRMLSKMMGNNVDDIPDNAEMLGMGDFNLKKGLASQKQKKSSGGGLFANIDRNDLMIGSQLGGAIGDMGTRSIKGELAATQAATAPFANSNITELFEQGPAGGDITSSLAEGYALGQLSDERDRLQELRKIIGQRASQGRQAGTRDLAEEAKKIRG